MAAGVAVSVAVGAGCMSPVGITVIVAYDVALLFAEVGLVQVSAYVVVTEGVTISDPFVLLPVENPIPAHSVAFVELQVKAAFCPAEIVVDDGVSDTVGDVEEVMGETG